MNERGDGQAAYERACQHDRRGQEAEAIPKYEEALALGLSLEERRGALVGLGSSLRNVGRHEEAVALLRDGVAEFPEDAALRSFLALAQYSAGDTRSAMIELLDLTIRHAPVGSYVRALSQYRNTLP